MLLLKELSLREKIGQLLCLDIKGISYEENDPAYQRIVKAIDEDHIGGLILFHGNILDAGKLLNHFQKKSKLPLLVSSDIERGVGQILKGASEFPTNMAIGATFDPKWAYLQGEIVAKEARAVGIHIAYAPVADVNSNPDNPIINTRSYGEDPEWVARFVEKYVKGVQDNNAIATAKHFPGHGDTKEDSHAKLPVLHINRDRFNKVESLPFIKAIEAGVGQIMSAHIAFPELTQKEKTPATLSKEILTDLLKKEMGFNNLVVTDALNMAGVKEGFSEGDAAVLAIKAGVDILLYPNSAKDVIDAVVQAVESGSLTEQRIDESVKKVLEVKKNLGLFENRLVNIDKMTDVINNSEHQKTALDIAKTSVTLISPDRQIIPFHDKEDVFTAFSPAQKHLPLAKDSLIHLIVFDEDESDDVGKALIGEIRKRNPSVGVSIFTPNSINKVSPEINPNGVLLLAVFSKIKAWKETSGLTASLLNKVNELLEKHPESIVLSFASPYIFNYLSDPKTYICMYSFSEVSQIACVEAIFEEVPFHGIMPVSLKGHPLISKKPLNDLES